MLRAGKEAGAAGGVRDGRGDSSAARMQEERQQVGGECVAGRRDR